MIKKYFCPSCNAFRNRFQVKDAKVEFGHAAIITGHMCKECGYRNVKETEKELKRLILSK